MGESPMLRLFFACALPEEIRERIRVSRESIAEDLPPSRWVRPETQHLTISFLGDTPKTRVRDVIEAVRPAVGGFGALRFSLEFAGFFPNEQHPRVAWIGGRSEGAAELAASVAGALEDIVPDVSGKRWKLHLTQARMKKPWPPRAIARFKSWVDGICPLEFSAGEITLYSSVLKRGGAVHTVLERIPLT